jgi:hypothetical protein
MTESMLIEVTLRKDNVTGSLTLAEVFSASACYPRTLAIETRV